MDRHINYGMAFAGAFFLGVTVFVINYPHGVPLALVAAAKQATYTFFVAGFITRNSERIAVMLDNRHLSLLLSVVVSTAIAVGLTYLVHSLRGTAEPLLSTIPTMITGPLAFIIVGVQAQRKFRSGPAKSAAAAPD